MMIYADWIAPDKLVIVLIVRLSECDNYNSSILLIGLINRLYLHVFAHNYYIDICIGVVIYGQFNKLYVTKEFSDTNINKHLNSGINK